MTTTGQALVTPSWPSVAMSRRPSAQHVRTCVHTPQRITNMLYTAVSDPNATQLTQASMCYGLVQEHTFQLVGVTEDAPRHVWKVEAWGLMTVEAPASILVAQVHHACSISDVHQRHKNAASGCSALLHRSSAAAVGIISICHRFP